MRIRSDITYDKLYDLYIVKNMTVNECSAEFKCNRKTLYKLLKFYNIVKSNEDNALAVSRSHKNAWAKKSDDEKENIMHKLQNSLVEKYGVKYASQSKELLNKRNQSNIEKYGDICPLMNESVRKKRNETMLKKYNTIHALQNEKCMEKMTNTCMRHFNVKRPIQNAEIKARIQKTFAERYLDNPSGKHSSYEFKIIEFIKSFYNGEVLHGVRSVITPYELDIYLPDINLAIEFNGDYWHSDAVISSKYNMSADEYHTMKNTLCEDVGVSLIFIWEHDWNYNQDAIKQMLKERIGI